MAFMVNNNGNITLIQGDSGELIIEGLNTDKNYKVYLAIQDEKRRAIGNEICVDTNCKSSVILNLPSALTNLLQVKKDDDYAEYYYGIKVCDEETGLEDTLFIGGNNIEDLNIITVYPKRVEGTLN